MGRKTKEAMGSKKGEEKGIQVPLSKYQVMNGNGKRDKNRRWEIIGFELSATSKE